MPSTRTIAIGAVIVVAAIAAGLWGWFGNQASAPEEPGEPLVAITVPDLTVSQEDGKFRFDRFCARCHGDNATGQDGVAPPLVHRIYEPGHHGDAAFLNAALNGVRAHHWPFGNMPPVEGVTPEDVNLIVDYVRALQRANGIE